MCAQYNGGSEDDEMALLKLALKGTAAQILCDQGTVVNLNFNDLVRCLMQRFGSESQSEKFCVELMSRRYRAPDNVVLSLPTPCNE